MAQWDRRLHPLTHCSLCKPYRSYFKAAETGAARSRQSERLSVVFPSRIGFLLKEVFVLTGVPTTEPLPHTAPISAPLTHTLFLLLSWAQCR